MRPEEAVKATTARKRGRPALPSPVASAAKAAEYLKATRPDENERRILIDIALEAKREGEVNRLWRITREAKSRAVRAVKRAETAAHKALTTWRRELAAREAPALEDPNLSDSALALLRDPAFREAREASDLAAREACDPLNPEDVWWLEKEKLRQLAHLVDGLSQTAREFEETVGLNKRLDQSSPSKTRNPFTQTREMHMAETVVRYVLRLGFRLPLARELAALAVLVGAEDPKPGFDAGLKQINAWEWRLRELRKNPEFSEAMRRANSAEKPRARRT